MDTTGICNALGSEGSAYFVCCFYQRDFRAVCCVIFAATHSLRDFMSRHILFHGLEGFFIRRVVFPPLLARLFISWIATWLMMRMDEDLIWAEG